MPQCLTCDRNITPFMSFGPQPIANGFLSESQFDSEFFYDMEVAFCEHCGSFQLVNQPCREQMFNDDYAFFSGTSAAMAVHFQKFADEVKGFLGPDPFVAEIGCNDGIMLKHFAKEGIRHLGIEPSANVAAVAQEEGIEVLVDFFDENIAQSIIEEKGKTDAFVAANVMCHIPYIHSTVKGIKLLLKEDGIAVFEDPYLGDIIANTTYDQIYDEHVFLFSVRSIKSIFEQHDLDLFHVSPQKTHGGSMRYYICHKGAKSVSEAVRVQEAKEEELGLHLPKTYQKFKESCENYRRDLVDLVRRIRSVGNRIVGYAATSKSTTILNYCGLGPEDIEFISDTTPIKQGKFSPGAHIPVKPHDDFVANYPDYALLFAYNHSTEIMAKETAFAQQGGRWIMYYPSVTVSE